MMFSSSATGGRCTASNADNARAKDAALLGLGNDSPSLCTGASSTTAAASSPATAHSAAVRYGVDNGAGTASIVTLPGMPPTFSTPDLVERSAFLFGLLHSNHLLHDIHDAIDALNAAVSRAPEDTGIHGGGLNSQGCGGPALSAVFYFPARPPSDDMPWRPIYRCAVLLCVFSSAAAAQYAIAAFDGTSALGGLRGGSPASTSVTLAERRAAPRISLRTAREFALGPEGTDAAFLTFLTTPYLVDVMLRRQHTQMPHASNVASAEGRREMTLRVATDVPPPHITGSCARLYAAILSSQSPYAVDWAAARVAVARGDGVVIEETKVVEPWVFGGDTVTKPEIDGKERSKDVGDAVTPLRDTQFPPRRSMEAPKEHVSEQGSRSYMPRSDARVPMTLQEEDYRRRYSLESRGSARRSSVEGLTELMPSRNSLYRGAQGVFQGVSWLWRRAREQLSEDEATLKMTSGSRGGSSTEPSLPCTPPRPTSSTPRQPSTASTAAVTPNEKRDLYEPPRTRRRTDNDGSCDRQDHQKLRSEPMVIPRYNALGVALSGLPGFHLIAPLFVTSVTSLAEFPTSAAKRNPRRRSREVAAAETKSAARDWDARDLPSGSWTNPQCFSRQQQTSSSTWGGTSGPISSSFVRGLEPSSFLGREGRMSGGIGVTGGWSGSANIASLASAPPRRIDPTETFPSLSEATPHFASSASSPMLSSIAPATSSLYLTGPNGSSTYENTFTFPHRAAHSSTAADSLVHNGCDQDSRVNSGLHRGRGEFKETRPIQRANARGWTWGAETDTTSATQERKSAMPEPPSGMPPRDTLADELRTFGADQSGDAPAKRHTFVRSRDKINTTEELPPPASRHGRSTSKRSLNRTVEFTLPGEER